jgi:predicted phosphodiesterase
VVGPDLVMELTTLADDEAVIHDGSVVEVHNGLAPDTDYDFGGVAVRTLPRPPGERLATVASVNDLHLGEKVCGLITGVELGPPMSVEPGEPPYPETMSRGAAAEILAASVDAVVAKGDLTARGSPEEFGAFLDCYAPVADRLHYVRGNHDVAGKETFSAPAFAEVVLPGAVLALLDTSVPRRPGGAVSAEQLEWLDELSARSDRPVLVFGHHPPDARHPGAPDAQFGLSPAAAQQLMEVVARRRAIVGYFAGHTHRNRVRHFPATGDVPWVEVAAVKDFPGGWAEYRVFEGGILQVFRRISSPAALDWSERTRAMFGGLYPAYSFGTLTDRCFVIWPRPRAAPSLNP